MSALGAPLLQKARLGRPLHSDGLISCCCEHVLSTAAKRLKDLVSHVDMSTYLRLGHFSSPEALF